LKRWRFALAMLCFAALAAAGVGLRPALAAASVSSAISSILQKHDVAGGSTGVYIWDFDAAQQVFASHADSRLVPASNMKLVTTSAALGRWGPQHRFKTELYGPDVPIYEGVLYGNLYLKGFGDPSLSTLSYQRQTLGFATASFESFAKRLRTLKVHKVKGRVLGDESWFDEERSGSSWTPGLQLECGLLSALSGNESLASGNRVKDPATYAAQLLTEALGAKGIKVTGKPGTGEVPATARLLKQQFSAPLKTLLKRMDKHSDNFFAEIMLKGLGKDFSGQGSTLEDRMRGTAAAGNAHAKTGTLNIAVCLSGYVTSANERQVGYAILVNGGSVSWGNATAAQDDIVELLAASSLSGARRIRVTPLLRQHPQSAFEAVNPVGSFLQAVVQP